MKKPVIAVIGRPNVGKSTFVNRIIGARKAIVDDMPGVTRDRSYHDAEWRGQSFTLVDTGGLMPDADIEEHPFADLINLQVEAALAEAALVVFLVDGQAGITAVDADIAEQLRRSGKPVLLAVNKIDRPDQQALSAEFYALSLGDPFRLSALHGNLGVGDLLDEIVNRLPARQEGDADGQRIRLALIGRPNVGKSSILNGLLGESRAIVSPVSGTTRDALDAPVVYDGQEFILVDTAGIRKKAKVSYGVEMFSVDRSIRAVREADVTVMVLDATENQDNQEAGMVTDQDRKIIQMSNEAGRALVLVVNKWDAISDKDTHTTERFRKALLRDIPHAAFAPIVFTSAVKGQRLTRIFDLARMAAANAARRVKTSLVNEVLAEAFTLSPPPAIKNKRLKLLYATQAGASPPTFILFVNDARLLKDSYTRYLERKLRENFEFEGTPIVIIPRSRDEKKVDAKSAKKSVKRVAAPPAGQEMEVSPKRSVSKRAGRRLAQEGRIP